MISSRTAVGVRRLLAALGILGAAGCHEPAAVVEEQSCRAETPFPITGCGAIAGNVVGLRGQPLAGVQLTARSVDSTKFIQSWFVSSGNDGTFRVRVLLLGNTGRGEVAPDTLSVYLIAQNTALDWALGQPKVRDSTLTLLRVAREGAAPDPSNVTVWLEIP